MGRKLEHQLDKLDPRLRMIANGDQEVNALRAGGAADVTVRDPDLLRSPALPSRTANLSPRQALKTYTRKSLEETADDIYINVFVQLKEDFHGLPAAVDRPSGGPIREIIRKALGRDDPAAALRRENLLAVEIPLGDLQDLLEEPGVVTVERTEQIQFSPPIRENTEASAPVHDRCLPNAPDHHEKVLIGIIDVGGFDFSHPDFLIEEGTRTRFLRIWDQGGQSHPPPQPFSYGSEITAEHMNRALNYQHDPYPDIPAYELEPQSQMIPGSHATHVASIAAGKHGICPDAYLAGVLINLPREDLDRRKSFYDSSRLLHAVEYLLRLADELGDEHGPLPVSLNISLGTNGHAHDASSATSRWLDHALGTAGRALSVAAGNAGQEAPAHPTDWGFVMGRIHTSGQLGGPGDTAELEWVVFGDSVIDISENELEIWYSPRDHLGIQIKPPQGDWGPVIEPGEFLQNRELEDGTFLSIYNERYKPANGLNYIGCYLSPLYSREGVVGVQAGTWKVRLIGRDVRDGRFHAWIERDDPQPFDRPGEGETWFFPSFFSSRTNVDNTSVSSLACGRSVISVANLDAAANRIHISSSQGPTRDGRPKPELAAPGTRITAAKGFDPDEHWTVMTGTSMASPYAAGVAGLMLAANPKLTASQIQGIMQRTARPLTADYAWQTDSGYGRLNPEGCLYEVERLKLKEVRP